MSLDPSADGCVSLHAGVNGWIGARADFMTMWQGLQGEDSEHYAVVWETKVVWHQP